MSTHRVLPAAAGLIAAMFWAQQGTAADTPGAMPGDDAMTCAQIAAELMPYMQQMMPAAVATAAAANDVKERAEQRMAEAMPGAIALTMAATAAHADPSGIASRGVGQTEMNYQQQVWNRSLAEDKPLGDKLAAQSGQLAAQGQQLQSNVRLQRLMQLVQQKNCDQR